MRLGRVESELRLALCVLALALLLLLLNLEPERVLLVRIIPRGKEVVLVAMATA